MACALTRQGLLEFSSAVTPSWLLRFQCCHAEDSQILFLGVTKNLVKPVASIHLLLFEWLLPEGVDKRNRSLQTWVVFLYLLSSQSKDHWELD